MTTTFADPDEPEEPDEPFDPSNYPDEFTVDAFREMPMRDLLRIERHLDDLTPRQRETFRSSRQEVLGPIFEKIREALPRVKVKPPMPRLNIKPPVSAELTRSMQRITDRLREQAALSSQLGLSAEPITGSLDVRLPPLSTSLTGQYTPAELERDVDRDTELLAIQSDMFDLMRKQYLATTRGAFFAVIVSMSVIVAGVAPVVTARDASERWLILIVSAAVGGLGLLAYVGVRLWQGRPETPPSARGS